MIEDFFDNEQWRKGYVFEKWVVTRFDPTYFDLVEWGSDKAVNARRPRTAGNPDLTFEYPFLGIATSRIAVECKWREFFPYDVILTPEQIANYQRFRDETEIPVFVVLGTGGSPDDPGKIFVIPLERFATDTFTPARAKDECYRVRKAQSFYFRDGILS